VARTLNENIRIQVNNNSKICTGWNYSTVAAMFQGEKITKRREKRRKKEVKKEVK